MYIDIYIYMIGAIFLETLYLLPPQVHAATNVQEHAGALLREPMPVRVMCLPMMDVVVLPLLQRHSNSMQ